uniref:Uncharacterized protein n=1 Tax=Amphiprion ocellaris TaxID=80972 RepID=A0A3Q1D5T3_AMPOC
CNTVRKCKYGDDEWLLFDDVLSRLQAKLEFESEWDVVYLAVFFIFIVRYNILLSCCKMIQTCMKVISFHNLSKELIIT